MSEDVLKITIQAAGDQAAAEMQKVAVALNHVTKESSSLRTSHQSLAKEVESLGGQFDNLVKHLTFAATGFQSFRAIFAGGVAAFGLSEIIKQTIDWDQSIQNLSFELNGNVVAASKWMALGHAFGVDATQLQTAFRTLSRDVESNNPVLKNMGIAIEDTHGKLLSMDQILTEVHQHLLEHANASNQAGEMALLFGRNTGNLTSLMMAQDSTWKAIIDDANKLGLIINGNTLLSFRAMEADIARTGTSLQALILAIGHGLLPALDGAGQAISSFIIAHLDQLKAALMNVVSFIIGFFEAFTGGTFQISALGQAIAGSATPAVNDFGNATGNAADSTKALTRALEDQIKVIDEQIKGLEEATALENYQDSLHKLQQKAVNDKKAVDKDYAAYQEDLLMGNQAQAMSVLDQLQSAEQTASDNQLDIQKAQDDEIRRLRINDLNDEKSVLQQRIQAIQDAANKGVGAIGSAMAQVPGIMGAAGTAGGKLLGQTVNAQVVAAGKTFGDNVQRWFADFSNDKTRMKAVQELGKALGAAMMNGFFGAINGAANDWAKSHDKNNPFLNWLDKTFGMDNGFVPDLGSLKVPDPGSDPSKDPNRAIVGYAEGGIVPGPIGAPRLAIVHGGEEYLGTPGSAHQRSSGGGTVIHFSPVFNIGTVDSEDRVYEVERVVRQTVADLIAS